MICINVLHAIYGIIALGVAINVLMLIPLWRALE